MEDAARRQVDTALTTALGRGEIAGFVHLPTSAAAAASRSRGLPVPAPFASMSDEQLAALATAVRRDTRSVQIEIVIGPTTRIGREGHHAATVVADLRAETPVVHCATMPS
jgi:hypothetical protein